MVKRLSIAALLLSLVLSACAGISRVADREGPVPESDPTRETVSEVDESAEEPQSSSSSPESELAASQDAYNIVTLLPPDAIPSIDNPRFIDVSTANEQYNDDEPVIGIEIDGEARAYSTALLSSHEIVNDMIGGRPIAVTW